MRGSIKEAIGKITGDRKVEAEGAAEKVDDGAEVIKADIKDNIPIDPKT